MEGRQIDGSSADHSPGQADHFNVQLSETLRAWSDVILGIATEEALRRKCPKIQSEEAVSHGLHLMNMMSLMIRDMLEESEKLSTAGNDSEEVYLGMLALLGMVGASSLLSLAFLGGTTLADEIVAYLGEKLS